MSKEMCTSCRRLKAELNCGNCKEPVCKGCAHFLEADTFSFLKEIPECLSHSYYCDGCYDTHVQQVLVTYQETMERARKAYFFFKTQRKQIPLIRKSKLKVHVGLCKDRDETILRLGFFAAEQGYNAIVEGDVTSSKVRNAGYEKMIWSGTGIPAQIDSSKLDRYE